MARASPDATHLAMLPEVPLSLAPLVAHVASWLVRGGTLPHFQGVVKPGELSGCFGGRRWNRSSWETFLGRLRLEVGIRWSCVGVRVANHGCLSAVRRRGRMQREAFAAHIRSQEHGVLLSWI